MDKSPSILVSGTTVAMDIWELKQPRRLRKVKHHICAMGTILQLLLFAVKSNNCKIEPLAFYNVDKLHYWWERCRLIYRKWKIYCSVFTLSLKPKIWKFHFVVFAVAVVFAHGSLLKLVANIHVLGIKVSFNLGREWFTDSRDYSCTLKSIMP